MAESPLSKKMKLKSGLEAAVINAPENYVDTLRHDTALSPTLNGKFDWIQIFVKTIAEVESLAPKAAKALNEAPGHVVDLLPKRDIQNPDRSNARQGLGKFAEAELEMGQSCIGE
jgi:hypothetical protein